MGDIVLTSPVTRMIKQQIPNSEVHFVTKAKYADLLKANPFIDKIHLLSLDMPDLINALKKEEFDYIIDLHRNLRSAHIKYRLGVPSRSFNKLNLRKWCLINMKVNCMPGLHVVDRYLATLSGFKITNDAGGLDYFIPSASGFDPASLTDPFSSGFVAFAIGGTYYTKRLPEHKIVEICNLIPFPVILLGGAGEREAGNRISRQSSSQILNLCGKITIHESASLIQQAHVVITHDTGLMHIAAAFRKKILSIWGNTVASLGMYPYMPHPDSQILQVDGLKCRPCSKLGFSQCPKGHFRCMNEIDTQVAAEWVRNHY